MNPEKLNFYIEKDRYDSSPVSVRLVTARFEGTIKQWKYTDHDGLYIQLESELGEVWYGSALSVWVEQTETYCPMYPASQSTQPKNFTLTRNKN